MHSKCTTKIEINKVGIEFTEKKITAYGGFSLLAAFFEKVHLREARCQEILSELFAVSRLPLASTTLTRLFRKIRKMKEVEQLSEGLWGYISKLIPWKEILHDWLTFDSTVLERYGKQEGVKRGYNPKKKGRGSHSPLLAFLNRSRYVVHLWNRPD